jgi:hypothetical protein
VALEDPHPEVLKQALDGFVVLASMESRKALESAMTRLTGRHGIIRAWIEEAIDQIDENASSSL